jgi:hypothetical protein
VVILDSKLNEIHRLNLPPQSKDFYKTSVALSRHGIFIAQSGPNALVIFDQKGGVLHRTEHKAWSNCEGGHCVFDLEDRLWHVQPSNDCESSVFLRVLEPFSGKTIAERKIRNDIGFHRLFLCPNQKSIMIEVACGQDGSFLHLARLRTSGLAIEHYPFNDRTFFGGGFSPDGTEFVTGAHSADSLKIHSFPRGQVVATIQSEMFFAGENLAVEYPDTVGYQQVFIDQNHILTDTRYGRLLLIHRNGMRLLGTVWPKGETLLAYDERGTRTNNVSKMDSYQSGLSSFHSAGAGRVLTVYRGKCLRLIDLLPYLKD